jgi:5-formyltetrahydrofolate cyclo-ligase
MNEKPALRLAAELRRQTLARPEHEAALAAHADALALPQGAVVAGYWPMKSEADPRALMTALCAKGHLLALPCVAKRGAPLVFHRWKEGDPLTNGAFGTSEPLLCAERVTPSVLLVPLLAFDAVGYRLGYGGGFYDRTLETLRAAGDILAIGIAYAGQEIPAVPHAAHDQRLDAILTENGFRSFHRTA